MNFEEELKKVEPLIIKICSKYNYDEIFELDDLVQNAKIRIWKAYGRYNGKSKFTTYIYAIVKNACIDVIRANKNKINTKSELNDYLTDEIEYEDDENIQLLNNAIKKLSEEDRMIINMWLDRKSYIEIASQLETNENNIRTKIFRIKAKLKVILKDYIK